jgi:hypothetical protein
VAAVCHQHGGVRLRADFDIEATELSIRSSRAVAVPVAGDVRERAAMGLCFERIPALFQSRYVVPAYKQTGMVPTFAWISHLPSNYAHNPDSPFGKVAMNALFTGDFDRMQSCMIEGAITEFW